MQKSRPTLSSRSKTRVLRKSSTNQRFQQSFTSISHISTKNTHIPSSDRPRHITTAKRAVSTLTPRNKVAHTISQKNFISQSVRSFADSMIPAADTQPVDKLRHELHDTPLTKEALSEQPIKQFKSWLEDAVAVDSFMPERMVISTTKVHPNGHIQPSSRPVLLKDMIIGDKMISPYQIMQPSKEIPVLSTPSFFPVSLEECKQYNVSPTSFDTTWSKRIREQGGLTFVTNYESDKAKQIEANPYCSLLFHWVELERVVRIEGTIMKVAPELSDVYHLGRPRNSRVSACMLCYLVFISVYIASCGGCIHLNLYLCRS